MFHPQHFETAVLFCGQKKPFSCFIYLLSMLIGGCTCFRFADRISTTPMPWLTAAHFCILKKVRK
jgi:hypothetical protein